LPTHPAGAQSRQVVVVWVVMQLDGGGDVCQASACPP
jgi:hypothetical protein